ncbi:hypothetical protein E2C01_001047 [Portunus trituberculatus]|uniref:Uncharacterized protein n=1 Tax=Portunus trituberculatus TaxID=210409 RepID=A0A5B7CI96_PORTR|nr:hypothetical protein [Portunus trituberculatus]
MACKHICRPSQASKEVSGSRAMVLLFSTSMWDNNKHREGESIAGYNYTGDVTDAGKLGKNRSIRSQAHRFIDDSRPWPPLYT